MARGQASSAFGARTAADLRAEVGDFLGVQLPATDIISFDVAGGAVQGFDEVAIGQLLRERPPFFRIGRAVALGEDRLLGVTTVTEEHCDGHFPGTSIVPLIEMCKMAAQTGVLLIALSAPPDHVPIAVGSKESKAESRNFIRPPATLLIEAKRMNQTMGLSHVDCRMFLSGTHVATLKKVLYMSIPENRLDA